MHRSTTLAGALALGASLVTAAGASAATGHACKINGGAAGCALASNISVGAALTGADTGAAAADDFVFIGAGNTLRCPNAKTTGILTNAGGPAYPIGGTGPRAILTGATINGPLAGGACTAVVGGAASTATVTLADSNGAAAGLVDVQGDWIGAAASPLITLRAPIFEIREKTPAGAIACTYRGGVFTGTVTNNAVGRIQFLGQFVTKTAGPAACPAGATVSVPFNLSWTFGGVSGPVRISA